MDWIASLTEAEASFYGATLSALITVIGAAIGILFGAIFFGGKVKTLNEAVEQAKTAATDLEKSIGRQSESLKAMENGIAQFSLKLEDARELLDAILNTSTNTASGFDDQAELETDSDEDYAAKFKHEWKRVGQHINAIATSSKLSGKRRAAYAQIPRYNWLEVFQVLLNDGQIPEGEAKYLEKAIHLWESNKRLMSNVGPEQVSQMKRYADGLNLTP